MGKFIKALLFVLMIVLAIQGTLTGMQTTEKILYPLAYENYINKYSREYNLNPYLVMGVIRTESDFVSDAYSDYAGGLMQLTEETAAWNAEKLGIEVYDFMDPETNIMLGCHYLRYLIDNYSGVVNTALAAYNGGMGNVSEWLENPEYSDDGKTLKFIPFTETRGYVLKVNEAMAHYRDNIESIRAVNALNENTNN